MDRIGHAGVTPKGGPAHNKKLSGAAVRDEDRGPIAPTRSFAPRPAYPALVSRLLAPLAGIAALAALGCAVGLFVLASRSDERNAALQRELVGGVFESYRADLARFAFQRAAEMATHAPSAQATNPRLTLSHSRHGGYRAYLLDGGGQVIASDPAGDPGSGPRRLVAELDASARGRSMGLALTDASKPPVSDLVLSAMSLRSRWQRSCPRRPAWQTVPARPW